MAHEMEWTLGFRDLLGVMIRVQGFTSQGFFFYVCATNPGGAWDMGSQQTKWASSSVFRDKGFTPTRSPST